MKNLLLVIAVVLAATLYSCDRAKNLSPHGTTSSPAEIVADLKVEETAGKVAANTPPIKDAPKPDALRIDKLKIIKDGNISVKAKDLAAAKKSIDNIVQNLHAYYGNEEYATSERQLSYRLTIRIPSANFEKFLSAIESGGNEITEKNIHARDVTEEYVDVEARLKNKRIYLDKYNELLSRATKMKDIIELSESIRGIMEEIESAEAHLRLLGDQVSYSSLSINLYQPLEYIYKPIAEDSFWQRVQHSLNNGWVAMVNLSVALLNIWPLIIIGIITLLFLCIKRKRIKLPA